MQIDEPSGPRPVRPADDTHREILAILAEMGLTPAQGVEAMLDRLFAGDKTG